MLPFILSVLIQLTVQILNHINVIVFQPHALDYPCLPVDFTCLLLLVSLSHECYVSSCLNSRWYLIKNSACCRVYLFCFALYFTVTLQYISLSQQQGGPLAGYSSMNAYFLSIFALWSHLVTIHSCLEYYSGKDHQASSEDCLTQTFNKSNEGVRLGENIHDDGDQRPRALPVFQSFWKEQWPLMTQW